MGKKGLVAGAGKSGFAASKLLLKKDKEVILYDGNDKLDKEKLRASFAEDDKVEILLGELTRMDLLGVELAVVSPGIPLTVPFVKLIEDCQIPIWGEIQLAYHYAQGRLCAITGTNGKTTTTALTGEIMKTWYKSVFVVGNIGEPYTAHALETTPESMTVAEISSFMLETVLDFHPNVSCITNITPDHLDRHGTMECYTQVKESITKNQTKEDTCVLNYDDPALRAFGQTLDLHVVWFSSRESLENGYCLDGDRIVYRENGKTTDILGIHDMQLLGRHNYENVMCAVAMAQASGVPLEKIREAV